MDYKLSQSSQVPNNPPAPSPVPQNPSTNPQSPAPQPQPNNPQIPTSQPQEAQPKNPAQSSRPQQSQSPAQQTNSPPGTQEPPSAGRGGGSGGSATEISQGEAQPSSDQPAQVGFPLLPSSLLGQLFPPLSQAQGTEPKTSSAGRQSVVPVLVTLTSNGLTKTTIFTSTPTNYEGATDLGRLKPSRTSKEPKSTNGAGIGAGSASGVTQRPAKQNSTAIIAGVVSAFVVIGVICAIIFFRARKKKQTPVVSSRYSTRSNSVRNVQAFFSNRFSRSTGGSSFGRSNTPALETCMERTPYMSEIEHSRRRSSSEPAIRSLQASPTFTRQSKVSGVSTSDTTRRSPSPHRRSVSSLSGMAYPVLTNMNNPFMDPDPNAPLRIVNPDLSRSASTATNPSTPGQNPLKIGAGAIAAANLSSSPLKQATSFSPVSRSMHQRSPSIVEDPFLDPETIMEDPFADSTELPMFPAARNSRMGAHQRNKSSLASSASQYSDTSSELGAEAHQRLMAGVPLITKTAPSSIASSHRYNSSGDSTFVSNNNSPASIHTARFTGLGISNILQRPTVPRTPLLPISAPQDISLLQPSTMVTAPPLSPLADRRISHNRLSSTSSTSDLSLSFPSSWGSPGPTRPASIATQAGGSSTSLAAALAAANADYSSVSRPRDSRASDPFDLDDPTLFSYAASQ